MTANAVSATSCHEYIATNEIVYKDYIFACSLVENFQTKINSGRVITDI